MNTLQILDVATAAGSGLATLAVLTLIRVFFRRGRNLEDA